MKTTIEMHGFEIVIEENEGLLTISAMKDGETVEEFTLDSEEEVESDDSEEIKGFEEFGQEEEDFEEEMMDDEDDAEDDEDDEDDDDEDDDDEDEKDLNKSEAQLESFQSFINKKRK